MMSSIMLNIQENYDIIYIKIKNLSMNKYLPVCGGY